MKTIIALLTALFLFAGAPLYAGNVPVKKKDRKEMITKKKKVKKNKGKKNGWSKNTHNPHNANCNNPGQSKKNKSMR